MAVFAEPEAKPGGNGSYELTCRGKRAMNSRVEDTMKHGKRILLACLGVGLVAVALWLRSRPAASDSDSSGEILVSSPAGMKVAGDAPASSTSEPNPAIQPVERAELTSETPPLQDSGAAASPPIGPAGAAELFGEEISSSEPADYAEGIATLIAAIQAGRTLEPEAIAVLLNSSDPEEQASGLALMAGLGSLDGQYDTTRHPTEVVLAAVDLCGSLFGDSAAQALLDAWKARMGGDQPAGEAAHTLLLEVQLPHGGGSTALDLMMSVNDDPSILAGLCDFAMNVELPPGIRADAFVRLRDQMDADTYGRYTQDWIAQALEDGGPWLIRAEGLAELVAGSSAALFEPGGTGSPRIEESLARPYPGQVEDLELYLRQEVRAGRLVLDEGSAAVLLEAIEKLDISSLAGPDAAAWHRLRQEIDTWNPGLE
jgi:hypothetical protein